MALGSDGLLTVIGDFDTVTSSAVSGKVTVTPSRPINNGGKTIAPLPQEVTIAPSDGTFSIKLAPTPNGTTYKFEFVIHGFASGERLTYRDTFDAEVKAEDGDASGYIQFANLKPVATPGGVYGFLTRLFADGRYVRTVNGVGPDASGNVTVQGGTGGGSGVAGVASVNGRAGNVTLSKADVSLGLVDNVPASELRNRGTHFGTQSAATINDFAAATNTAVDDHIAAGANVTLTAVNGKLQISAAGGTAPVQSVAGKTGAVSLVKADVGLGNVDNTTDLDKPVSTATQTALAGKAGTSHTHPTTSITGLPAAVETIVKDLLKAGSNVTFNSASGSLTINSTATASGGTGTDAEVVRDTIGAALQNGAGIAISVDDANDTITISVTNITPSQISGSTATGRNLIAAVDGAAARGVIGAGTSSLALGTSSSTAAAGNHNHTLANVTDVTTVGAQLATASSADVARTVLGAGTSNLAIGTTSTTAKAGNYAPAVADLSDVTFANIRTFLRATAAADARNAIFAADVNHVHADLSTWAAVNRMAAKEPLNMADTTGAKVISYDSDGCVTAHDVLWPDGGTGTYTTTTVNPTYKVADAYTITYVKDAITRTYTQAAVTRNSSGLITKRPQLTVA